MERHTKLGWIWSIGAAFMALPVFICGKQGLIWILPLVIYIRNAYRCFTDPEAAKMYSLTFDEARQQMRERGLLKEDDDDEDDDY